jgi:hypothetical protein
MNRAGQARGRLRAFGASTQSEVCEFGRSPAIKQTEAVLAATEM